MSVELANVRDIAELTPMSLATHTPDISAERWDLVSRQVRANMGLGRDKFARLLQVSPRTIMRWENGQDGETIVPQGIQRMKLLALSLDATAADGQQAIINEMLTEAASLRAGYEQKATTIRRYEIDLDGPAPAWLDDLMRLKREKNWSALTALGPHFLATGPLSAPVESLVCLWIGLAAFMEGTPLAAVEYYDRGIAVADAPELVRAVLLANKGYALIRLRRMPEAAEALEACLAFDPAHRGALRNLIVLHSQNEDYEDAARAAAALRDSHPEADDPNSELGRALLEDPDIAAFRTTEPFARVLRGLAQHAQRSN